MLPYIEDSRIIGILRKELKVRDFPYCAEDRKCPHLWIINVTPPGYPHCFHKCPFCYARWAFYGDNNLNSKLHYYTNLKELAEKELEKLYLVPPISISNITDPCQPIAELRTKTKELISFLLNKNLTVLLCTKGDISFLFEDAAITKSKNLIVQISIEGYDDVLKFTSPFAVCYEKRLEDISIASRNGKFVILRIDPFFYHLWKAIYDNDWEDVLRNLIQDAKRAGVKHIIASTGRFWGSRGKKIKSYTDFDLYLNLLSKFSKKIANEAMNDYQYSYSNKVRALRLKESLMLYLHGKMRTISEEQGLTYAACQELTADLTDSKNLIGCYGMELPFCIKNGKGEFIKLQNCTGYCFNCDNVSLRICREFLKEKRALHRKRLLSL